MGSNPIRGAPSPHTHDSYFHSNMILTFLLRLVILMARIYGKRKRGQKGVYMEKKYW
jgi:hypothetical protein